MLGNVNFTELLNWHYELRDLDDYEPPFSGIADMRKANMLVTPDNLHELVSLNKTEHFVSGRWVNLVDTPIETAMSTIYKEKKSVSHAMELLNTEEAASEYLEIDVASALETLNDSNGLLRSPVD
ncbi:MAG: hypothetical protein OQK78_05210 [Gammaproteobacteria bacterium]|nr:hypothetical protein [Gammaproteobacteria bacterium]